MQKKYDRTSLLLLLLAMFSTMPIVGIPIGNQVISGFMILLPITLLLLIIRGIHFDRAVSSSEKNFLLFFSFSIFSAFWGATFFLGELNYSAIILNMAFKTSLYIFIGSLFFLARFKEFEIKALMIGLLIGAILNLIWATIDAIIFYSYGYSINNEVFAYYANTYGDTNIRYGMLSLIVPTGIRAAGFNYDPAHIGMLAPFVFAFSYLYEKKWLLFLVVCSILASQSMTALVSCLMILIILNFLSFKNFIPTLFFSILILLIILVIYQTSFGESIQNFWERANSKVGTNGETDRDVYNFMLYKAIVANPAGLLCGTGFGSASYAFYKAGLIRSNVLFDPENTYVAYLFDTGIVGLFLYFKLLYGIIKMGYEKYKKSKNSFTSSYVLSSTFAIICACFFYHYILYATSMMMVIISCSWCGYIQKSNQIQVYPYEK